MKKLISISIVILFISISYSQNLQKGNLVSAHVGTVNLNPDVTFDQYKDFFLSKWAAAVNDEYKGEMAIYLTEGERGEYENKVCILYVYKSVEARNKYWPEADSPTDLQNEKFGKIQPIFQELNKLGAFSTKYYTDWVVQ